MARQERRLNKRFVAILTIAVMLALTVVIAILIIATARKDPAIYADRADKALARKDYVEAARSYLTAYRHSGKDPTWLLKVADAQYRGGDERRALSSLQTAVLQDPTLAPAQKRYLEILYEVIGGRNALPAWMKEMEDNAQKLLTMITEQTPEKTAEKDPALRETLALAYHARGVARYGRRGEEAALESQAHEDIRRAIELDAKPEYVETLAAMILDKTQQVARTSLVDTVDPAVYDTVAAKIQDDLKTVEKLYLNLAEKSSQDSAVLVSLGNFYFQIWGNLEKSLGDFCRRRAEQADRNITTLNRRLTELTNSTTISADEKRRTRARILSELTDSRQDKPEWTNRSKRHGEQADRCGTKAVDLYRSAVDLAGEDNEKKVNAMMALTLFYLQSGSTSEAEKLARETVTRDQDGYRACRLLVDVLKEQAGRLKDEKRQAKIDEIITLLVQRIYETPTLLQAESFRGRQNRMFRFDLMVELARLYMERNQKDDLKKADDVIRELDQSPMKETASMYLLQGQRAILGKDLTTAIIKLEKADKLGNERNAQVKLALAELYLRRQDVGAARQAVDQALTLAPNSPVGVRLAAAIYLELGEHPQALDFLNRLLAIPGQETDKNVLLMKLQCLAQMDRLDDAEAVAREMKVLGAKLDWPTEKARLLLQRGRIDEAEKLLSQYLQENPGDKSASVILVDLYAGRDQIPQAQAILKTAIEKNPDDKGLVRARELLSISDPKKRSERLAEMTQQIAEERSALALAEAEGEKDPYLKAMRYFDQYARQNELDKARQYLDEAMKIDPKRANALKFRLALIQKDWPRAQESADFARQENLDGLKGLTYEAELANRRAWCALLDKKIEQAQRMEEAKKFLGQSIQVAEQVLGELPNDSQAHALLGEGAYLLERYNDASEHVTKALELNPTNAYALRARSLMQWERIVTGQSQGQALIDLIRSFSENLQTAYQQIPWDDWLKERMDWLRKQAAKQQEYAEDETGDARQVLARREAQRREHPDDVENLMRLARVYASREEVRDLDKAEQCYRDAYAQKPSRDMMEAYLQFAGEHKRTDGIEKFLTDLAEKGAEAKQAQGYTNLGLFYLMSQNPSKAESAFVRAQTLEDTPARRLELAGFYFQMGNFDKAIEWSRETLKTKMESNQERAARTLLINALMVKSDWDQARGQIEDYQKKFPDADGKVLQARLAIETGKMADADQILTQVLESNPGYNEARDYRAIVSIYAWKLDKALTDMEHLAKSVTRLSDRIKLIKLRCELNQTADAEREARSVIEQMTDQSPDALERVRVDLLPPLASALSERNYDELLVWAGNLMRNYWGWPYERGQYFLVKQKFGQAEQAFAQAWKIVESTPAAPAGLKNFILDSYLESIFKQRAYDRLIQTAEKALSGLPSRTARVQGWQAAGYLAKDQPQKGFEIYTRALTAAENNPLVAWQTTRGTILKATQPGSLIADLEKWVPVSGEAKRSTEVALASCYFAADQIEKGAALYRQLAEQTDNPTEKAMLFYILGQEYTDKRQYADAVQALTLARKTDPENMILLNNMAYILVEYLNQPQEAFQLAQQAIQKAPNNADLLDTYGQALVKLGKNEEGMHSLTKSVWIRESSASRYHLGLILQKQGRRGDAETQLRRALQLVGDDRILENQIREVLKQN